jgi:hypothetical protein
MEVSSTNRTREMQERISGSKDTTTNLDTSVKENVKSEKNF